MEELTPRQREVLALIRAHIAETGYPPTRADIARSLGFRSANAAEEHLRALARKGVIEISKGTSRGLRLAGGTDEPAARSRKAASVAAALTEDRARGTLPVIGRVAAGHPILAEEHVESQFEVSPSAFRPRADYLLRVRGDSMRNIGILAGDLLAVHAQPTADPGQVVVARIDDEVTVKRFARGERTHEVRLLAENDDFAPIVVDLRERSFAIEGLAVGVLRSRL
jgi:repressor LexA